MTKEQKIAKLIAWIENLDEVDLDALIEEFLGE